MSGHIHFYKPYQNSGSVLVGSIIYVTLFMIIKDIIVCVCVCVCVCVHVRVHAYA